MRALIAEDNAALARVIAHTLDGRGFEVAIARDGDEAWQFAQTKPFDLVITDHQMPRMTGLELAEKLKDCDLNRETPIILLTAKGLELDAERVRTQFGVVEVMIKPFSPTILGDAAARYALQTA